MRGGFAPVASALIGISWLALWLWGQSPYARYLEHARWTEIGAAGVICRALPAGGVLLPLMLYAGGWVVMTAAMMLPAAWPLFRRFERMVQDRPDRRRLVAGLIGGYLTVWLGFGVAAHLFDIGLHEAVRRSDWLSLNGWALGAVVLTTAGLFQFSRFKYRCLAQCRAPFSFIAQHWHGPTPLRNALRLGLHHGVFCVGCCWALMLLMFVVGTGNVGWMLALGAIMAVEKNMAWGHRLGTPLGAALLVGAAIVAGVNLAA
jgi:predicted metal-binding membrane protein